METKADRLRVQLWLRQYRCHDGYSQPGKHSQLHLNVMWIMILQVYFLALVFQL